ncbi:hypothetical protein [Roseibacillus persicicus]|uniref:Uncharacterized protein n=1 Tax=Roseibacillus persicicus TaxID=454148 RepID=A0A918WJJ1_9BACT|nr:hypothetical protein [Roseibacillus persicicus]MDQ8192139.1 hypothetical protein [Roseibacillus persicicus]GHC52222.1 hypothetical protein GCM10007100_18130 [Roseibacillus persicicus]
MKHLTTLPFLIALAGLSSCALSSEKQAEEDQPISGSIPPPTGANLAEPQPSPAAESLPEIDVTSEQSGETNPTEKLIKSGDFIFSDPTIDLPKSQDLASPPSSLNPKPTGIDNSSETDAADQPLVLQP